MYFLADVISCGGIPNIPIVLPNLISLVINIILVVVPILLIIFGMLDLGKAVTQGKEDDIKKGQALLIKRIIAAVTVFLVISIVQLVVGIVADSTGDGNVMECVSCFVRGTQKSGSGYICK